MVMVCPWCNYHPIKIFFSIFFFFHRLCESWDVAQVVEHGTGMPLKQVRLPGAARDFSPRSQLSDSLMVSVHPHVQLHTFTLLHTLKIP